MKPPLASLIAVQLNDLSYTTCGLIDCWIVEDIRKDCLRANLHSRKYLNVLAYLKPQSVRSWRVNARREVASVVLMAIGLSFPHVVI